MYSLAQTTPAPLPAGVVTVTGGASAVNVALDFMLQPAVLTQSTTVTPDVDGITAMIFIGRPYLNRQVELLDYGDVTRPARTGLFPVIGRTMPVAITDTKLSRQVPIVVATRTVDDATEMDAVLASGDPIYLRTPPGCSLPTMYAVIGDVAQARRTRLRVDRYFTLPLTEVAAPGADVVGSTATYQTVLSTYATYADVLAAHTTYADLLELVASPGEVVVG